jgi:hypothetical protein
VSRHGKERKKTSPSPSPSPSPRRSTDEGLVDEIQYSYDESDPPQIVCSTLFHATYDDYGKLIEIKRYTSNEMKLDTTNDETFRAAQEVQNKGTVVYEDTPTGFFAGLLRSIFPAWFFSPYPKYKTFTGLSFKKEAVTEAASSSWSWQSFWNWITGAKSTNEVKDTVGSEEPSEALGTSSFSSFSSSSLAKAPTRTSLPESEYTSEAERDASFSAPVSCISDVPCERGQSRRESSSYTEAAESTPAHTPKHSETFNPFQLVNVKSLVDSIKAAKQRLEQQAVPETADQHQLLAARQTALKATQKEVANFLEILENQQKLPKEVRDEVDTEMQGLIAFSKQLEDTTAKLRNTLLAEFLEHAYLMLTVSPEAEEQPAKFDAKRYLALNPELPKIQQACVALRDNKTGIALEKLEKDEKAQPLERIASLSIHKQKFDQQVSSAVQALRRLELSDNKKTNVCAAIVSKQQELNKRMIVFLETSADSFLTTAKALGGEGDLATRLKQIEAFRTELDKCAAQFEVGHVFEYREKFNRAMKAICSAKATALTTTLEACEKSLLASEEVGEAQLGELTKRFDELRLAREAALKVSEAYKDVHQSYMTQAFSALTIRQFDPAKEEEFAKLEARKEIVEQCQEGSLMRNAWSSVGRVEASVGKLDESRIPASLESPLSFVKKRDEKLQLTDYDKLEIVLTLQKAFEEEVVGLKKVLQAADQSQFIASSLRRIASTKTKLEKRIKTLSGAIATKFEKDCKELSATIGKYEKQLNSGESVSKEEETEKLDQEFAAVKEDYAKLVDSYSGPSLLLPVDQDRVDSAYGELPTRYEALPTLKKCEFVDNVLSAKDDKSTAAQKLTLLTDGIQPDFERSITKIQPLLDEAKKQHKEYDPLLNNIQQKINDTHSLLRKHIKTLQVRVKKDSNPSASQSSRFSASVVSYFVGKPAGGHLGLDESSSTHHPNPFD